MTSLDGQVAVITGAGGGLGRGHAEALAQAGAHVVACDVIATGGLDATAEAVRAHGRECLALIADVRDPAALQRVAAQAAERFGRIDILVANAGIVRAAPLLELSDDDWHETLDVDLTGVFHTIRAVAPAMIERRYGRIVVIGSVSGRIGQPRLAAYNAAKWGVIGLSKAAALELGPFGITVNVVCPGTVDTPLIHHPDAPREFLPDATDPTWDDLDALLRSWNPMGVRWVGADEVAAAVLLLAGPAGRHISGTTIDVAAGFNAHYTT